ncbi:hypothetical protein HMPREF9220_0467 [Dialister micraerophilus UPII 345-E]|uniref:Uncharacterized protein n=1 Tax=Dialister micraerophilus UPII 345-E TaxID=910314 RepID=E4L9N9_9FIRM|nr:hypothetical protein HMPREF9220_0467 [Dialister micraerophilus UPII 345-E]
MQKRNIVKLSKFIKFTFHANLFQNKNRPFKYRKVGKDKKRIIR